MYSDDFWLSRSVHPGLRSHFGGLSPTGGNPFNRSRHSRHGFSECTTCSYDPFTSHHICQCYEAEQCLEIGRLLQGYCDCRQCPLSDPYDYEDSLYFAGYGRAFGRGIGDNYYGSLSGRAPFYPRIGGFGGLGSLAIRGHGRFGVLGRYRNLR